MAKNDMEQNEYTWDSGTYQTGATEAAKAQSGLITGLLIAVIFLGGLASALGLMNVRLISQLMKEKEEVLPVSVDATEGISSNMFEANKEQAPKVPDGAKLQLQMGPKGQQPIDPATVIAQVTVIDNQGQSKTDAALILSADGYLLTNAYLTDSALSITAQLPDGSTVPAALVACDPYSDLAVVYIGIQGLTPVTFSDDPIITTGNLPIYGDTGFVFEDDGRVKGMLCLNMKTKIKDVMYSQQLMDIGKQLVEKGCVSGRPGLGLQVRAMSNFCREYWDLSYGVEITETEINKLLAGDILLSINGQQITTCHQVHHALMDKEIGQQVTLEIFRAGKTFALTLPVIENP